MRDFVRAQGLTSYFEVGRMGIEHVLLPEQGLVLPGDVVVGDSEGVIVIPAHLADEIAAEATEMTAFEDFVTEKVMEGRTIIGLYPPTNPQTLTDFAAWRQAHGR